MKQNQLLIAIIIYFGICANVYADKKGNFSENQICKAGIAKIMGKNPAIIKIDRVANDSTYLSYVRQADQTRWKYKCKIEGNRIIWGADTGRWRTHPMDSKITFNESAHQITVIDTFSDGSSSSETYSLGEVGE